MEIMRRDDRESINFPYAREPVEDLDQLKVENEAVSVMREFLLHYCEPKAAYDGVSTYTLSKMLMRKLGENGLMVTK